MNRTDNEMQNVGTAERVLSVATGLSLVVWGASRRSKGGSAMMAGGGVLLWRGLTGRCPVYRGLGWSTCEGAGEGELFHSGTGITVDKSIMIHKPVETVYAFWRDLGNLPRFMSHLKAIEVLDEKTSVWNVKGPLGVDLSWKSTIFKDKPNQLIAWKSEEKARIPNMGTVHFARTLAGEEPATEVRLTYVYHPPGGQAGASLFRLFGEAIAKQTARDLQILKEIVEAKASRKFADMA